jgi:transposase InsO family protein
VHPARYRGERRELAKARRAVFHDPPSRRNRVWQTDFSELETCAGGIWQLGGVVDYVSKFCLTCPVTATKTWREAVACLESARERATGALGHPLVEDLVDLESGELRAITIVRTRHRSPETNGVIERWLQSLKYEHLYLREIDDGPALAEHVAAFERIYNDERPHEAIAFRLPRERYLQAPIAVEEAAWPRPVRRA